MLVRYDDVDLLCSHALSYLQLALITGNCLRSSCTRASTSRSHALPTAGVSFTGTRVRERSILRIARVVVQFVHCAVYIVVRRLNEARDMVLRSCNSSSASSRELRCDLVST